MKKTKFWNITKNEEENSAEIILYGSIGTDDYWDDITDKQFKKDIENLGDVGSITLNINSPGGDVFSALAIGNTLKNHKANVIANIDGLAASAATIITCCCDVVRMPKNALFMIHNPATIVFGEQKDLEKSAELLNKVKNSIIETYLFKSNIDKEKLSELMDNETWLSAGEAKEYGFIDEILDEEENISNINNMLIVNNMAFDISQFKNCPVRNSVVVTKEEITVDKIKNEYPSIYQTIFDEGVNSVKISDENQSDDLVNTVTKIVNDVLTAKKEENKEVLNKIVAEANQNQVEHNKADIFKNDDGKVLGVSASMIAKFMNKK